MAPPALQKALVDTVNFEAVIQTASNPTLCGKISKVVVAYKQTNLSYNAPYGSTPTTDYYLDIPTLYWKFVDLLDSGIFQGGVSR